LTYAPPGSTRARALGLEEGDAHVIRNARGRAADALRSLVISQSLLGTREVAVVHHTDCGMLTFTDEQLREKLRSELGQETDQPLHAFGDLEQSVRDDVKAIRESPPGEASPCAASSTRSSPGACARCADRSGGTSGRPARAAR
jgi:carbonic anhydrase